MPFILTRRNDRLSNYAKKRERGGGSTIHMLHTYSGITRGWLYAICSRSQRHVRLLRQRCLPHLRGISFPSEGYVERLARRPKGSQAKMTSSSRLQRVPAVRCRRPPASLARTAAIRTSAVAQGSRTPDRDLPRCRPRVQTRSRTSHPCSVRNGAV